MTKMMKAARLYGPYDMRMMDVPVPELAPDEILAKVERACICGTDYAIYSGELSFVKTGDVTFPMTLGHEWAGTVAAVGSNVTRFKVGDRVVSDNAVGCGRCPACLHGDTFLCQNSRALGTVHAWDGAFAEYLPMPERHVFHLADNVGWDDAALLEPMMVAYSGVVGAEVGMGDTVLVNGTGAIGLIAAKICRICGASKVFVTGRSPFKLEKAAAFGAADVLIDTSKETIADALAREIPNGKVDKVIEASGSIPLLVESLNVVRTGGIVSALAFYEKEIQSMPIDKLVFNCITLRGVASISRLHEPCLRLLESGRMNLSQLITGRYPFADIETAMKDMKLKNASRIKWAIDFS